MSKAVLSELKLLRAAVVRLAGGSGLPEDTQLSPEVLEKAEHEFKKLRIMNHQWLDSHDLTEYFKIEDYRHNVGYFIINQFKFTNFFIHRKSYYYNKADIISLAKELKARNVNLSRYMDFKSEEAQFIKNIQIAFDNKKANKNMPYWLSDMVQDVENLQSPRPDVNVVETEIKQLTEEFDKFKLSRYIDVYQGQYAMVKTEYQFKKYISDDIKKQCNRWCVNFNYALNALKILDERKANSIKMRNEDEFEL